MFIMTATRFGKKIHNNRIIIRLFKKKIKMLCIVYHNKGKGKFYPRAGHETQRGVEI